MRKKKQENIIHSFNFYKKLKEKFLHNNTFLVSVTLNKNIAINFYTITLEVKLHPHTHTSLHKKV